MFKKIGQAIQLMEIATANLEQIPPDQISVAQLIDIGRTLGELNRKYTLLVNKVNALKKAPIG